MHNSIRIWTCTGCAGLGITALAAAQCDPQWVQLPGPGPSPRFVGSMGFDQARNVDVLFGGAQEIVGGPFHGDTWEFSRATQAWIQRSTTGPQARYGVSAVYMGNTTSGSVYLFGGSTTESGLSPQNDTWRWDGSNWVLVTFGATPRYGASLAYDSARHRIVLFGGFLVGPDPAGDTWEFDGAAWQFRTSGGPPPRGYAGIAYHPGLGRTVMFGGNTPSGALGDTWEWDGENWSQVSLGSSPPPRLAPVMAYDPASQSIVLFSGLSGGSTLTDTWTYDGQWQQIPQPALQPSGRAGAMAAFDLTGQLLVMGGYEGPATAGDTWLMTCGGQCYPNCDSSTTPPILNVADFGCFLSKFAAGDPYANCDGSTTPPVLNVADFGCFLQQFAAGCN